MFINLVTSMNTFTHSLGGSGVRRLRPSSLKRLFNHDKLYVFKKHIIKYDIVYAIYNAQLKLLKI